MGIGMRGIPLRCPYLYTIKRNKSVSDFSYLQTYYTRKDFMEEISLYEKIVSSEIGFIIMDLNRTNRKILMDVIHRVQLARLPLQ